MEPTLPVKYKSWADDYAPFAPDANMTHYNPWNAPGWAPVESSCGLAGGYYESKNGFPGNGGYPPIGVAQGFDGVNLPVVERVVWEAGSEQEVAVSVHANHGGGYSYRLCPEQNEYGRLSEECFQKIPLDFASPFSWVQWGDDKSTRKQFEAVTVSEGTKPEGSQWRRFPMPACSNFFGGDAGGKPDGHGPVQSGPECASTQFSPPVAGLFGYGLTQCIFPARPGTPSVGGHGPAGRDREACSDEEVKMVAQFFNVNFIDTVKIPSDLAPGNYVLSWRHDCEQSPQVWASCADIKITVPAHPQKKQQAAPKKKQAAQGPPRKRPLAGRLFGGKGVRDNGRKASA